MSVNIRVLQSSQADFEAQLKILAQYPDAQDEVIDQRVAAILADVKARGDAAVLDYTAKFDSLTAQRMSELEITREQMQQALARITPAQREALTHAVARVRAYHERQFAETCKGFEYTEADGTVLGQKVTPLDSVGVYVPGGKAAYPSSLIMDVVPAKVAGVERIVMMSPTPNGERNDLVLAAAYMAGVDAAYTVGGAQAVAALAYGTTTIGKVDKIVGPGNAYVAVAKRRVFGTVGIDMIAGPSEILVLADGSTPPEWSAIDLFSQAEHDELAQSILLTPNADYLNAVKAAIDKLLPTMPRKDIITASLEGRGALILTRDMREACEISNRIAPEHLEVQARDATQYVPLLKHAGAIFLGAYTSESLGDYCAGPNHVLPTSGTARFSSPLGVYDFVKRSSIINVSEAGAQVLGKTAAELAYGERLPAHARAAELRVSQSAELRIKS